MNVRSRERSSRVPQQFLETPLALLERVAETVGHEPPRHGVAEPPEANVVLEVVAHERPVRFGWPGGLELVTMPLYWESETSAPSMVLTRKS